MDRNVAQLLMKQFLALDEPLNSATLLTEQILDAEEKDQFRRGIGEIVGAIYVNLMIPILKQYPDLDSAE